MTIPKKSGIALWSLVIGIALAVAGCASSAERSAVQTLQNEAASRTQVQAGGTLYSRANLPKLGEDSTLQDYLAYAALNNPQLEAAFNRWKAALAIVPQARALSDPHFNYGYFIQQVETRVGPENFSIGVSQAFPWFGKLKWRGEAALEGAHAARQQYETAKLKLFDEVAQAFYDLYYLGRAIVITRENVTLLKQFEEVAQAKYEAGTALHGDVIKAQVELDKLRDRLRTLQDLKSPTAARLNAALNRASGAPVAFPKAISQAKATAETTRLVEELRDSNPELKGLDYLAEKEKANIALAKKEFYPDLTLWLNYIAVGPARTAGVDDSGKDPVILGFSVNVPLWWEKYRAGVREAESRYAATREERQATGNRLTADLKLALFKYGDAERKIALYREALIPKADENLKVIRRSYEAGKSDFLSLIDAERILLEFQLTYERAVADREEALSTVAKLVGGGSPALAPNAGEKP